MGISGLTATLGGSSENAEAIIISLVKKLGGEVKLTQYEVFSPDKYFLETYFDSITDELVLKVTSRNE